MGISFACQQIDFKDLLRCSFDLNKTEYRLFMYLLDQEESLSVSAIGEATGKDRTTVQKAMKKLIEQNIVHKHQVNLEQGGYTFVYAIKDKEFLRRRMLSVVEHWYNQVMVEINKW
jgi:predicted transcriptional regulator